MTARSIHASELLDTEELAARLGITARSLRTMRAQPWRHRSIDGLPAPLRLVSGRPVWSTHTIDLWITSRNFREFAKLESSTAAATPVTPPPM